MTPIETDSVLPGAHERKRLHTRRFVYECYLRDDGLWDIDAELVDVKDYPYATFTRTVPPHEPIHRMAIRLTVDETMTVRDIVGGMAQPPFDPCTRAVDPLRAMIGVKIGPGWRRQIDRHLGGVKGCTHLRDLLFNAGTAAYQSVDAHALHERLVDGTPAREPAGRPHFVGKCVTWALDGPAVREYLPEFYEPPKDSGGTGS